DGPGRHLLRRRAEADLRHRARAPEVRGRAASRPPLDLRAHGLQARPQRRDDRRAHRPLRTRAQMTTAAIAAPSASPTGADKRALRLRYVASLRRRLVVAGTLGALTMLLAMVAPLVSADLAGAAWRPYVLFLLATPVQLWAAAPFYRAAWNAARHGTSNMNTLIVVGTTAAYGLSVAATFFPALFVANGLEPHASLYYATSTAIIALVLAGRFIEARARAH